MTEDTLRFWSSVDLTGNQTSRGGPPLVLLFWSSVDLTGNQTTMCLRREGKPFWSSVDLTGNQTFTAAFASVSSFGAVSI